MLLVFWWFRYMLLTFTFICSDVSPTYAHYNHYIWSNIHNFVVPLLIFSLWLSLVQSIVCLKEYCYIVIVQDLYDFFRSYSGYRITTVLIHSFGFSFLLFFKTRIFYLINSLQLLQLNIQVNNPKSGQS